MTTKSFLIWGGWMLILLSILGVIGIIGPTPEESLFGATWYFSGRENLVQLALGALSLIAAVVAPRPLQRLLVGAIALVYLALGTASFFLPAGDPLLMELALEDPYDGILYLALGLWAAGSALGRDEG
ncbi:MAG: hypothetical protein ACOYBJ_01275 [Patescibacteria group bacterium]|jgi:hypothetical protein